MDTKAISIKNIGLSNRAKNALLRAGINTVGEMLYLTEEQLITFRNVGSKTIQEIIDKIDYINSVSDEMLFQPEANNEQQEVKCSFKDKREAYADNIEQLYRYVEENDVALYEMGLSQRPMSRLHICGCRKFSDVIRMSQDELKAIPSMGKKSVDEILDWINGYITKHEGRIQDYYNGDETALWNDEMLRGKILDLYKGIGFNGLSLGEMIDKLLLPDFVTMGRIKQVIGKLLAEGELEYVDYRCYRKYDSFEHCLDNCTTINERERDFIKKRLQGYTLDAIAQDYNLTRERVRQVANKGKRKVWAWYSNETGNKYFDEDYYRSLYENYSLNRSDAAEWLGVSTKVWNYLNMNDVKQGGKNLTDAYRDQNLDFGLRLKIKNYLNRNKLFINGRWIEKRRSAVEDALIPILCLDDISFKEFAAQFNAFLQKEEIPYDEDLYYTESVIRTRKNRLAESRHLLWKQNEQMRFYDIDGLDYDELLETLNLDSYENIELSTMKFIEEYPDVMKKYDVRDQYELHNLLRKIIKEEEFNDLTFGKMPMIKFGSFDKDEAIFEMMSNNAPIDQKRLADLMHEEYGYDQATVLGTYVNSIRKYLVNGVYVTDQKKMVAEHMNTLSRALTDDFYFIDEIKSIYRRVVPDADTDEINQYNLDSLGFTVYARYALQNHDSLEQYFRYILLAADITDITAIRKRYCYVPSFSNTLSELKSNYEIIEFEPNEIVSFSKLERGGVTRDMIEDFCDAVYEFVEDDRFFSISSIKLSGFDSELFQLGFSNWFYANILTSDDRFSYGNIFGSIILCKGDVAVIRTSFLKEIVLDYESIDAFDLLNEMADVYECKIYDDSKYDIVNILKDTVVYYDEILDRFYANDEVFYDDLERNLK